MKKIGYIAIGIVVLLLAVYFVPFLEKGFDPAEPAETVTYINSMSELTESELILLADVLYPEHDLSASIIADTYVSKEYPTSNYGQSSYLWLGHSANCGPYKDIDTYVMIDFSNLYNFLQLSDLQFTSVIESATLKLRSVYLLEYPGDPLEISDIQINWNEDTITYNSRPQTNFIISQFGYYPNVIHLNDKYLDIPLYNINIPTYKGQTTYLKNKFEDTAFQQSKKLSVSISNTWGTNGNCHIEHNYYSKESNYDPYVEFVFVPGTTLPWCVDGESVQSGFTLYECIDSGTRIRKTTAKLTTNVPPLVYEYQPFEIGVATGDYTDSVVIVDICESDGTIVQTVTGTIPTVYVSSCPLSAGGGLVRVKAMRGGITLIKESFITVSGLELLVTQPPYYTTGETFNLGVAFTDPEIQRPVAVRFYELSGGLISEYFGNMPSITISDPQMTGNVIMNVSTSYGGKTYIKEFQVSFDEIQLVVVQQGVYDYGLTTSIQVYILNHPEVQNAVSVKLMKGTQVLEQYMGTMPQITLTTPRALGTVSLIISTSYLGVPYNREFSVFFSGYPVLTTARTNSYIQYEMDPVIFYIDAADITGEYLTPSYLSDIQAHATLSLGTVNNINWVHKGSGTYEITADVSGVGNFIGQLIFTYLGVQFESNTISISIEEDSLAISTVDIPSFAVRGEWFNGIVKVYDPYGNLVNPDNIYIFVRYPDGDTTELIGMNKLSHISVGTYQFSFKPDQLESYTFEITAEKGGITTATSIAHVAVNPSSDPGDEDPLDITNLILQNIWIVIISFFVIIILLWRFRR